MRWQSGRRSTATLLRSTSTGPSRPATPAGLLEQGRAAERTGDWSAAEQLYRAARVAAQRAGDQQTAARVEQNLGALADVRGDIPSALLSYTAALFRYRILNDRGAATDALTRMAMAHADLGEHDAAQACFEQARSLVDGPGNERLRAHVELQCAAMHVRSHQFEQAREACDAAHRIFAKLDDRAGIIAGHKLYGMLYREMGKYDVAELHLALAARQAELERDPLLQAGIEHEHACLHLEQEDGRSAIVRLNSAHARCAVVAQNGRRAAADILLQRIDATYRRALEQWASDVLAARDPYTLGHCRRVGLHAERLGRAVGIRGRELGWLRIGAFLHDIGKAVVPCAVLDKPGALDADERRIVQQHALLGAQIVAGLDLPYDLTPIVRSHHERWDGAGYPDGLVQAAIPLHARIVAVADVHDALTTARAYSEPCDPATAARVLEDEAGRSLDPRLVQTFREIRPRA